MKINSKGSFTAEASIVVVIIFLIVLLLVKTYFIQFTSQYGRKMHLLGDLSYQKTKTGVYIDQYEQVLLLDGLSDKAILLKTYKEELDYLQLMHHYLILDDLGEVLDEALQND